MLKPAFVQVFVFLLVKIILPYCQRLFSTEYAIGDFTWEVM
jgi:hypothetical protein